MLVRIQGIGGLLVSDASDTTDEDIEITAARPGLAAALNLLEPLWAGLLDHVWAKALLLAGVSQSRRLPQDHVGLCFLHEDKEHTPQISKGRHAEGSHFRSPLHSVDPNQTGYSNCF